jgi:hypothetical protein
MPYEYQITFKLSQVVNVFANDSKEALEKARSEISIEEKKLKDFSYKVKKMRAQAEPERTSEIPFGKNKKKRG